MGLILLVTSSLNRLEMGLVRVNRSESGFPINGKSTDSPASRSIRSAAVRNPAHVRLDKLEFQNGFDHPFG